MKLDLTSTAAQHILQLCTYNSQFCTRNHLIFWVKKYFFEKKEEKKRLLPLEAKFYHKEVRKFLHGFNLGKEIFFKNKKDVSFLSF